ncbi:MAG: polyprenyl synthetase family protein [Aestuariivita sp.]|nr:polyprenyl synthetase family protein [Aestuariivita sp.]MCY4202371.1 polyprenyl synthetase family protein [Aestuariivita sp.]MCY4288347.1 polyprenyl synthetase family protein [Aestuariivita sp.]MCY4346408.1 polyprenyl synthetase family protein [Aestuariivita sp.]
MYKAFDESLTDTAGQIEKHFERVLSSFDQVPVTQAMAYAVRGGKKLRGFLVIEGARLHGINVERAIWPAMAAEAIHTYSLIHDDLPCMDDDSLRRGQPTIHVKWDEATAVLAGDALQTLAFEMVARPEVGSADVRADLGLSLARASGAGGMVYGQALDIAAETESLSATVESINHLQKHKTGALIQWSAEAGARLAGEDPSRLGAYSHALGLAFQIADDILDVEGDIDTVGKAVGKDADLGKATFVSLLGLKGARQRARDLVAEACDALSSYGKDAECLRQAAHFVILRQF